MKGAALVSVLVVAVGVGLAAYFGARHSSPRSASSDRMPISSLTTTRVSKPETSGMTRTDLIALPVNIARDWDGLAYRDVHGKQVRVFYGMKRPGGAGVLVVLLRGNAGLPDPDPHSAHHHIRFELYRSPMSGGTLHVRGVNGRLLQLTDDSESAIQFDMARDRFVPTQASTAPCRLSHFAVALGPHWSEATGQRTLELRLANHGPEACVLNGYPRVTLEDAAGAIPFVIRHGGDQMISARPPLPVLVRPGQSTFVAMNKYRCDGRTFRLTKRISIRTPSPGASGTASIVFRAPEKIPFPYRIHGYCGSGDLGSILTVSPFVPTVQAAMHH